MKDTKTKQVTPKNYAGSVSFPRAHYGNTVTIWGNVFAVPCSKCGINAVVSGQKDICTTCQAAESVPEVPPEILSGCRWCHGTGKIIGFTSTYDCEECKIGT